MHFPVKIRSPRLANEPLSLQALVRGPLALCSAHLAALNSWLPQITSLGHDPLALSSARPVALGTSTVVGALGPCGSLGSLPWCMSPLHNALRTHLRSAHMWLPRLASLAYCTTLGALPALGTLIAVGAPGLRGSISLLHWCVRPLHRARRT